MTLLGIAGSLRAASVNRALLQAATRLTPPGASLNLFDGIGALPLFNPDIEDSAPAAVLAFRRALHDADAVVIASPEYAHGVTGVIKNALDWVVGTAEFERKPVALPRTAPRAEHAPAALRETLVVMGAAVVDAASLTIPLSSNRVDDAQILAMPDVVAVLRDMLKTLAEAAIEARRETL
ncbi:FMN reductase [Burkholderia glumae]|nr:FMN reductase [Burkholderia glumae]